MKAVVKKKLIIKVETTLDSSEAVMFQQGGEHRTVIPWKEVMCSELMDCITNDIQETELLFTVQIEKGQVGRHAHIIKDNSNAVYKPMPFSTNEARECAIATFMKKYGGSREEAEREIPKVEIDG
jgi:hypothetical protein